MVPFEVLTRIYLEVTLGLEWGDPRSQVAQTPDNHEAWLEAVREVAGMEGAISLPFEMPDLSDGATGAIAKHYPGLHDQLDHGNWAAGLDTSMSSPGDAAAYEARRRAIENTEAADFDRLTEWQRFEDNLRGWSYGFGEEPATITINDDGSRSIELPSDAEYWPDGEPVLSEGVMEALSNEYEDDDYSIRVAINAAVDFADEQRSQFEQAAAEEVARTLWGHEFTVTDPETGDDRYVSVTVDEASHYEGELSVELSIYVDGEWAGTSQRLLTMNGPEGGPNVDHSLFRLEPEYSGLGIAAEWFELAENAYIASGVSSVTVHAADIGDRSQAPGAYVWASMGFDWQSEPGGVIRAVDTYVEGEEFKSLPRQIRDTIIDVQVRFKDLSLDDEDYPTPREVSQLGRIPGVKWWPGWAIMASQGRPPDRDGDRQHAYDWFGIKRYDAEYYRDGYGSFPLGLRITRGQLESARVRTELRQSILSQLQDIRSGTGTTDDPGEQLRLFEFNRNDIDYAGTRLDPESDIIQSILAGQYRAVEP